MFDSKEVEKLVEGDRELLQALVDLFSEDWPKSIKGIDSALAVGDVENVVFFAHRIKGSCRNFFAHELTELSQTIEERAGDMSTDEIRSYRDKLEQQLKCLELALRQHLRELEGQTERA